MAKLNASSFNYNGIYFGTGTCEIASFDADVVGPELDKAACRRKTVAEFSAWLDGYSDCLGENAEKLWENRVNEQRHISAEIAGLSKSELESYKGSFEEWIIRAKYPADNVILLTSYMMAGYSRLNWILRNSKAASLCMEPHIKRLKEAFATLSTHEGDLWRGISLTEAELAEYQTGKMIDWPAFSSTSVQKETALKYIRNGSKPKPVLFKLKGFKCKDISKISTRPESEIVCMPGTRVVVETVSGLPEDSAITLVILRPVAPP